ncbi:MAG: SagB/ThcOx family dehydrogenase [Gemmatimonadota bacterium]|nr:SagB/ThcOx family dehydrogenase [Gemmatimonadota bacterium]
MTARPLPPPRPAGPVSLEEVVARRRTHRTFGPAPLPEEAIGQLLWATQGVTSEGGLRAAPSAMEAYPLELYVATAEGVDAYEPDGHALRALRAGDLRPALRAAAHDQESVTSAPAVFIVTAVYDRMRAKLGPGAEPYVHMDLGHAAQNLLLQATALGLVGVPIAWLDPDETRRVLDLPGEETPLYLVPVGEPAAD